MSFLFDYQMVYNLLFLLGGKLQHIWRFLDTVSTTISSSVESSRNWYSQLGLLFPSPIVFHLNGVDCGGFVSVRVPCRI